MDYVKRMVVTSLEMFATRSKICKQWNRFTWDYPMSPLLFTKKFPFGLKWAVN